MRRPAHSISYTRALAAKRLAASFLCVFAVLALTARPGFAETRVALVVGNSAYETTPLRNARRDAELMQRTLSEAGFDVIAALDADGPSLRKAVTEFARRLKVPDSVGLFYYAGHGVQEDGENYLIPLAAGISDMSDVALNAVALGDVMKAMVAAETRLNIVILDACRDNPFAQAARGLARGGLAAVVAPSGTIIGYATAPGQTARDGAGDHSPYTAALAANIAIPGFTLEEVFRTTRRAVLAATAGRQTPWEHSSLVGAFFFKPAATQPETSAARAESRPGGDARLAEIEAWERIKGSRDPAAFKAHVARFPNGLFAELASVRIAKLETRVAKAPWSWIITGSLERSSGGPEAAAAFEQAVRLDGEARTDADLSLAASLYREAAEQGIPQAMYQAARAFDKGRGVARDLRAAAEWYQRAAGAGHAGAMAALGTMYEFGEGVEANLAEALRLYKLAADQGDAAGLTSLAYLIAEGKGAAKNAREARRLYAAAAAHEYPRALFNLALMELRGEGGRRDPAAAVEHLVTASGKGHTGSELELAYLYDEGKGVRKDADRAARHILGALKAAKKDGRTLSIFDRPWTFATRRAIQRDLAARGLYHGLQHGLFDRATRMALAQAAEN